MGKQHGFGIRKMIAFGPKPTFVYRAAKVRSQPKADMVSPAFALTAFGTVGGLRTFAALCTNNRLEGQSGRF